MMTGHTKPAFGENCQNYEKVREHLGAIWVAARSATVYEPAAFSRETLFEILQHIDSLVERTAQLLGWHGKELHDLLDDAVVRSVECRHDVIHLHWEPDQDDDRLGSGGEAAAGGRIDIIVDGRRAGTGRHSIMKRHSMTRASLMSAPSELDDEEVPFDKTLSPEEATRSADKTVVYGVTLTSDMSNDERIEALREIAVMGMRAYAATDRVVKSNQSTADRVIPVHMGFKQLLENMKSRAAGSAPSSGA